MLSVEVGPSMLPVEATNIDLGVGNSVTPIANDMYNLGHNGLRYRNLYARRAAMDTIAASGATIILGKVLRLDGETEPWWRMESAAIYPEGLRDIGTSACNVATNYATNVSIRGVYAAT